jgi:hypothetical protein
VRRGAQGAEVFGDFRVPRVAAQGVVEGGAGQGVLGANIGPRFHQRPDRPPVSVAGRDEQRRDAERVRDVGLGAVAQEQPDRRLVGDGGDVQRRGAGGVGHVHARAALQEQLGHVQMFPADRVEQRRTPGG